MAMRWVVVGRVGVGVGVGVRRVMMNSRFFSSVGRVLGDEERAAENIYIKKMEREKLEKAKLKAEKEKAEKEKAEKNKKAEEATKS